MPLMAATMTRSKFKQAAADSVPEGNCSRSAIHGWASALQKKSTDHFSKGFSTSEDRYYQIFSFGPVLLLFSHCLEKLKTV